MPDEKPTKRRRATIERTELGVRARIDVAPDDPTRDTVEAPVREFIAQAVRRWKMADEAEYYNRVEGKTDVEMVDGEGQWDASIVAKRQAKKRPCLIINRFIPMISYVANEQRQMHVGAKIQPVGGGADPDTARILQGLIRSIENDSHAETIYDTAFEAMLEKGWSWFRVISEYEGEDSFHQVLRVQGFVDDFCVYVDPNAKEPTRRDMEWAFIVEDIPRGEYVSLYPKSQIASLSQMRGIGDDAHGWLTNEYIRVAEYYYVDYDEGTLVKLVDGSGRWEEDLIEREGILFDKRVGQPVPVEYGEDGRPVRRQSRRRRVKWAKINAVEILEGNEDKTAGRDMKATWIPLIMVAGRQRMVKGQRRLSGMVRHNREQQRVYNYLVTGFVESVALAPKAPYIAAAGQIAQYKQIWDTLNEENWPVLPYDPMTKDMQAVPPPQRQSFEPPVQALGVGIVQFDGMIKAGFNIYDSALGKRGSQESGKAMLQGKMQTDSANMNWIDNLWRAIQHTGEVLLDLIPSRYSAPRVVTLVRPDNEREEVLINQLFTNEQGDPVLYDLAKGKYSCTVSAGMTTATKRQEALQNMFALMEADPQLFRVVGDLVMNEMDWPGAQKMAERLKRALPPELRDPEEGDQIPPEVQQQIQQLMMQYQALMQEFEEAKRVIDSKQIETEGKKQIAELQARTTLAVAAAKIGSAEGMKRLEMEFQRVAELLKDNRERLAIKEASEKKTDT